LPRQEYHPGLPLPVVQCKISTGSGTKRSFVPLTGKAYMRGVIDFEALVDQHYGSLYRFAYSLSGNADDASDLVQDTFQILMGRHEQITDTAKVKTWLSTTLYRLFIGRRKRMIRFPHDELDTVKDELPDFAPNVAAGLDWQVVTAALMKVDEVFRAPVALFYLEDYSYNEIAATLAVPLGTVKSRIARGIGLLQKAIVEENGIRAGAG
jgi:RNA polymerase sigma factor (sigma-70 family)